MKSKSLPIYVMFIVCIMTMTNISIADEIRGINIDFVTIGNAGNPGDTRAKANPNGGGTVDYNYRIGKYEVTNNQWNAFVLASGEPAGNIPPHWMGANIPRCDVTWYGAAQFCNYLTSGDKSKGAYLFSGDNTNPGNFLGIDRDSAISTYQIVYVIPTQEEWYKAAYYKPDGSGYSTYANGTDVAPIKGVNSNYDFAYGGQPWDVGTGTMEQNGTFDMMGNLAEWNETLFNISGRDERGYRGGMYKSLDFGLQSAYENDYPPEVQVESIGFRIASIPEPATLLLLGLGGLFLRKRK